MTKIKVPIKLCSISVCDCIFFNCCKYQSCDPILTTLIFDHVKVFTKLMPAKNLKKKKKFLAMTSICEYTFWHMKSR